MADIILSAVALRYNQNELNPGINSLIDSLILVPKVSNGAFAQEMKKTSL
jgi:hypothetical protein